MVGYLTILTVILLEPTPDLGSAVESLVSHVGGWLGVAEVRATGGRTEFLVSVLPFVPVPWLAVPFGVQLEGLDCRCFVTSGCVELVQALALPG